MLEFMGRTENGGKMSREVFINTENKQIHAPDNENRDKCGWNGEPPPIPSGERQIADSSLSAYECGYEKINWGHDEISVDNT